MILVGACGKGHTLAGEHHDYHGSEESRFHGEVTWCFSQARMFLSLPEASELFNAIG